MPMWNGQFMGLRRNSVSWAVVGENIESAKFSSCPLCHQRPRFAMCGV